MKNDEIAKKISEILDEEIPISETLPNEVKQQLEQERQMLGMMLRADMDRVLGG